MLFNSYVFLLVFLPVAVVLYFSLCRWAGAVPARLFLLLASWFFYAWWNPVYLPLLLLSIAVNFSLGEALKARTQRKDGVGRGLMTLGVLFNLGLLGYFKYMDFFILNLQWLGFELELLHLALPLAISFFSLQQIAYIVDCYRGSKTSGNLLEYSLFVSFFPQLIAGPIVHHREVIPQLTDPQQVRVSAANLSLGVFMLTIGLFKKVVLADTFAVWANQGFDVASALNTVEAWLVSYSYTLQLYFDFSGYSDMAFGLALMFNIRLPFNFNSPYKATSIINLWQRWHLTLTRFINTYVYKPVLRALPRINFGYGMVASFTAMLIAGVWHGAAWSFVLFGILQGAAIVINHIWRKLNMGCPAWLGWLLTFHFFSFSLVIFRSVRAQDAERVYLAMLGLGEPAAMVSIQRIFGGPGFQMLRLWSDPLERAAVATGLVGLLVAAGIAFVSLAPNSNHWSERFQPSVGTLLFCVVALFWVILLLGSPSEFIYFQF